MSESGTQLFLGRQPILGREQQLSAYELLFRSAPASAGNQANVLDPTQATATVIANTFTEMSSREVLGAYRGFINIDCGLLFNDVLEVLPREQVVLEIIETIKPTPDVIARCKQLRDLGFVLAVDDIVHSKESYAPLFNLAEIIKIDIMGMGRPKLNTLVSDLRTYNKQMLAEKVETLEQYNYCKRLGFDLFQGYYFAKPTIIVGKKLNSSQLILMRLMGLIMEDANTLDLEEAFKLEPGLTLNLLRLTNSVSNGLSVKVTSLRQAITVLGRKQLQRWIQLLIYTGNNGDSHGINPLLQLSATRGRLMELLSEKIHPNRLEAADQSFMVGIMSLMPTVLNTSMQSILAQLPISQNMKEALSSHSGELGKLLRLAEATESHDPKTLDTALLEFPGLPLKTLQNCLIQAFSWANNLGSEQV